MDLKFKINRVPSQHNNKAEDYHGNVDSDIYITWFLRLCQQLYCMNLKCLISIDNASYHKKRCDDELRAKYFDGRTLHQATVPQLKAFLNFRGVQWWHTGRVYKSELLKLAQQHYGFFEYKVHHIANIYEHKVIFTPPYWPEFQPIEEIFGIFKRYVGTHRREFTIAEVECLANEGLNQITSIIWQHEITKVRKFEEDFDFIQPQQNPHPPITDDDECIEEQINFYDSPDVSDDEDSGNE